MTLAAFQLLLPLGQLRWVLHHGTYLAQCWDEESAINLYETAVHLYHCAGNGRGFFVEVGVDDGRGLAVVLYSFIDSEALANYMQRCGCRGHKKAPPEAGEAFLVL